MCLAKTDLCALKVFELFTCHLHTIFSKTIRFNTKFPTVWCIMCISVAIFYAMYEIILFHDMGCTVFGPVGGLKFAKWANFQCIIILGTETNLLNQIWWKSDCYSLNYFTL